MFGDWTTTRLEAVGKDTSGLSKRYIAQVNPQREMTVRGTLRGL